jgi:hypothetical protein
MAGGDSVFDGPLAPTTIKGSSLSPNGVPLLDVEEYPEADGIPAVGSAAEPVYGVPGDLWRPLDPTDDGAAEAVCARSSDGLPVVAARDLRIDAAAATDLEKGTRRISWYRGVQISMSVAASGTGSVLQIYVPFDHDGDGVPQKGHVMTFDPVEGAVTLLAASGAGITLASDGSATVKNGDGDVFLSVSPDGVIVSGDLRVPNSNAVFGDPALAKDVALAQPLVDVLAKAVPMLATIAGAVNGLAPGSVPPSDIVALTVAGAPYLVPAAGAVPAAPTTRAPRILGQPGA